MKPSFFFWLVAGRIVACEETLAFLDSPARQEQMPGIPARELLVRLATAAGKPDEAETLA